MKLLALAALFAAGLLVAGAVAGIGGAQTADTTTETVHLTTTVTSATTATVHQNVTVQETTTAPATTVITTETTTVATTETSPALPSTTAPTTTSSSSGTPAWVWVLLALLAAAVVGLVVALLSRRDRAGIPEGERRQRLQSAIDGWTAQGWALVTQTADTAVLQRDREQMSVSVSPGGEVSARSLTAQPPDVP
jgi:hypothetical protein